MVSCENDKTTPVKSKHYKERSLPTCHHCGMVGHSRPNCGQLKFPRTWNKKNAPKKEKEVCPYFPSLWVERSHPTQVPTRTCLEV